MDGKKVLFYGKVTPDEAARQAQVVVVFGERWFLYAPAPYRAQGEGALLDVRCPVVDCSSIPDDEVSTKKLAQVIGTCVDAVHGVLNKSGLLTGLEALGAVVTYPNEASATQPTGAMHFEGSMA